MENFIVEHPVLIGVLVAWEIIWKLIAMWNAARRGSKVWFIVLALVNTIGILPIIYLTTIKKPDQSV